VAEFTFVVWCYRCGKRISNLDAALIGDKTYCHPSLSTNETCYMKESRAGE
jgi:hypothetical protein